MSRASSVNPRRTIQRSDSNWAVWASIFVFWASSLEFYASSLDSKRAMRLAAAMVPTS